MEDLSSWRRKEARRCSRDGAGAQPPSGSTSPLSLAPPCPPSYSLQLRFLYSLWPSLGLERVKPGFS